MPKLVEDWVSQANARQRRGRAGRVQEGDVYYVYSKAAPTPWTPTHMDSIVYGFPLAG